MTSSAFQPGFVCASTRFPLERLKRVGSVIPSNVDKHSRDTEFPVSLANYTDVYKNASITTRLDLMQATASASQIRRLGLRAGDTLITKDSETADDIGVPAYVPFPMPGVVCGYHLAIIRPGPRMVPRFVYWLFHSEPLRSYFEVAAKGLTRVGLTGESIGSALLPVPPLDEQRRIAAFLDYETARIDELIEEQERLAGLLLEKLRAIYASAVTTGLSDSVEFRDSGVQWLGSVPVHWTVAPIKAFAKLESGHTPSRGRPDFWIDCDIPWVSLNDSKQLAAVDYISDTAVHINSAGLAGSSARRLPARSVVFTRDATIGLAAITTRPMAVSQHIIAWVCDERKTLPEFLLLVLYAMKQELERHTFGATIRTIGMPDIRKLVAAFPPLDEQRDIARAVFAQKLQLEQSVSEVRRLQALLVERRSALITAAVTGQIDVSSWRPPDDWLVLEPA